MPAQRPPTRSGGRAARLPRSFAQPGANAGRPTGRLSEGSTSARRRTWPPASLQRISSGRWDGGGHTSRIGPRLETGGRDAEGKMAPVYSADPARGGGSADAGRAGERRDGVSGVWDADGGRRGHGDVQDARLAGRRLVVYLVHRDRDESDLSREGHRAVLRLPGRQARWVVQGRSVRHAAVQVQVLGPVRRSGRPRLGDVHASDHRRHGGVRRSHGRARDGRHPDTRGRVDVVHRERDAPRGGEVSCARARELQGCGRVGVLIDRSSVGATSGAHRTTTCRRAPRRRGCAGDDRSMNPPRALDGTLLGIYEVGARIGRGGMGEVYLARDTRLGRPVALKVLPERFAQDERFRERLLRESRLAASLDHPNVVPVYDAGEADGRLFIAMRYVDGVDLKALLRDSAPLAPERVIAHRRPARGGARRRPSARPGAPRRQAEQRAARSAGRP